MRHLRNRLINFSKQSQYNLGLILLFSISIIALVLLIKNYQKEKQENTDLIQYMFYQKASLISEILKEKNLQNKDSVLIDVLHLWQAIAGKYPDEYICIVNDSARLLLHSKLPQTVNQYTGDNLVYHHLHDSILNLSDICTYKINYLGDYVSSTGEKQIAAFVYIPEFNWTLGVHRSSLHLTKEIKGSMKNYMALMSLILLVFIPTVTFFMYKLFKNISLSKSIAETVLKKSEIRFQNFFHNSAIPIWEEDFSKVKEYFNSLKEKGISNFEDYFNTNPDKISYCASLVRIIEVNETSLNFFEIPDKNKTITGLPRFLNDNSLQVFKKELISLANGNTKFECEIEVVDLNNNILHFILKLFVNPGYENSLSSIMVSYIDINQRVIAEKELIAYKENLEILISKRTKELKIKNIELENFNQLFIGREFRIKELKDKIKSLETILMDKK